MTARWMGALALSVSAIASGVIMGANISAADADQGDGLLACNTYEICFNRDADNKTYQRHFYYSDSDHGNDLFVNVNTGAVSSSHLEDNAYSVRNRDGSCDVKVIDWNGALPSTSDTIPNNSTWTNLASNVRNQNNEHQRVNC